MWKLDRLGRSIHDLIEAVADFKTRGIGFRSIKESMIDTTTPTGSLIFHVFSAIAEYERGTSHERTIAGIAAARSAGIKFGRPVTITDRQWIKAVELFAAKPSPTVSSVAQLLGVSRQAIYRRLDRDRVEAHLAGSDVSSIVSYRAGVFAKSSWGFRLSILL